MTVALSAGSPGGILVDRIFVGEFVTGATGTLGVGTAEQQRAPSGADGQATALGVVEELLLRQADEAIHRARGLGVVELDADIAEIGGDGGVDDRRIGGHPAGRRRIDRLRRTGSATPGIGSWRPGRPVARTPAAAARSRPVVVDSRPVPDSGFGHPGADRGARDGAVCACSGYRCESSAQSPRPPLRPARRSTRRRQPGPVA